MYTFASFVKDLCFNSGNYHIPDINFVEINSSSRQEYPVLLGFHVIYLPALVPWKHKIAHHLKDNMESSMAHNATDNPSSITPFLSLILDSSKIRQWAVYGFPFKYTVL